MKVTNNNSTFLLKSTKNKSFGTAFCIDQDSHGAFLLTCEHVITSCDKEHLEVNGLKAEVQVSSSKNELIDLAVVYVKGLEAKPLKLSLATLSEDAKFTIDGFKPHKAGEHKQEELEGSIKKISQIHTGTQSIDSYELYIGEDDKIEKGYSGSAIVSKSSGQVVAVATDKTSTGKQAYAIPLKYLKEVWSELNPKLFDTITPFVGLSAFGREDRAYFFGRDKEIEEISTQLKTDAMMAVIGDSGSGKSSLIKAGVIPNYIDNQKNNDLHVIEMRPARNPFVELARFIATLCDDWNYSKADTGYFMDKVKSQEPQAIQSVFEQLFKEENSELLLYVDQFEELFTLCDEVLQKKFTDTLLYIIENQTAYLKIKIVFTMRRDYYNLLKKYESFYQNIKQKTYLVRRMSDENLKEVIERPLELLAVQQSEIKQLSNTILWDLGDEAKEITLLQIALTETWLNKAKYEHDLMLSYVGIGRVTGALSYLATNAMDSLDEKEKKLFKYIFIRIVKFNDMGGITRRLADRDEFSDEAWKLVQKLASIHGSKQEKNIARLLKLKSSNTNEDEEVIELIHETLTTQWETYVEWIRTVNKENRKRIHNVIIAKSKFYKKDPQKKFLLSGYALEESRKLLDEEYVPYLSSFEKEFIEKSEKSEASTVFWKRFGVGALILLLGLSGYFGYEANRAKNNLELLNVNLINILDNYSIKEVENYVNNHESLRIFNFIIKNFKNSSNPKILSIVAKSYFALGHYYRSSELDYALILFKKSYLISLKSDRSRIIDYKKNNHVKVTGVNNTITTIVNKGFSQEFYKRNYEIYKSENQRYRNKLKTFLHKIREDSTYITYIDLFQFQLVHNRKLDITLEVEYKKQFENIPKKLIFYEMLIILRKTLMREDIYIENWREKYKNVSLGGWDWTILENWIKKVEDKEVKNELEKALDIFKGHKND